jgi:uncharacterized protein YbdZ (MbtH family)
MSRLRIIQSTIAFLLLVTNAQAQTGNWQAVEEVPAGAPISVQARLRLQCNFRYATEDELVCDFRERGRIDTGPLVFRREHVRQVRMERTEASMLAGAAIGAGVGAAAGASVNPQRSGYTREGGTLLLGGIGGIIGGFVGKDFPFLHGKVVYQH